MDTKIARKNGLSKDIFFYEKRLSRYLSKPGGSLMFLSIKFPKNGVKQRQATKTPIAIIPSPFQALAAT